MSALGVRNFQIDQSWSTMAPAAPCRPGAHFAWPSAPPDPACRRFLTEPRRPGLLLFCPRQRRSKSPCVLAREEARAVECRDSPYLCLPESRLAALETLRSLSPPHPHLWPSNRCKIARPILPPQIPNDALRL